MLLETAFLMFLLTAAPAAPPPVVPAGRYVLVRLTIWREPGRGSFIELPVIPGDAPATDPPRAAPRR